MLGSPGRVACWRGVARSLLACITQHASMLALLLALPCCRSARRSGLCCRRTSRVSQGSCCLPPCVLALLLVGAGVKSIHSRAAPGPVARVERHPHGPPSSYILTGTSYLSPFAAVGHMPLTISSLDKAVRSAADLDLFERQAR